MLALDGSKHAVCPAEFALALVLDRGGADDLCVQGQVVLARSLAGRGSSFRLLLVSATC